MGGDADFVPARNLHRTNGPVRLESIYVGQRRVLPKVC